MPKAKRQVQHLAFSLIAPQEMRVWALLVSQWVDSSLAAFSAFQRLADR
jgi:hypothetical protein